jgi:hypothetical protein
MDIIERFEDKYFINVYNGCFEWIAAKDGKGYGVFNNQGAHRAAYRIYRKQDLGSLHVLHHCDNPKCVNPNHLFLGTHSDNMRDMVKKGRKKGSLPIARPFSATNRPPNIKLTDGEAVEIYHSKEKTRILAVRFGVTIQTIAKIRAGTRRQSATKQ